MPICPFLGFLSSRTFYICQDHLSDALWITISRALRRWEREQEPHGLNSGYRNTRILYVASSSGKLVQIRRNPAETRRMENVEEMGISSEKDRVLIDRRLSVAPMMDWTH